MSKVCFSSNQLMLLFFINISFIFYLATKSTSIVPPERVRPVKVTAPIIINKERSSALNRTPIEIVNYPKHLNDPLRGPERYRLNHINYNNVGFITTSSGGKYLLFGRQKGYRSNQYEYYITDSSNSNIKYPVKYKNYNEIFDKDTVDIPEVGGNSTATVYDLPELRYTPTY
jgi:hypothetical protein